MNVVLFMADEMRGDCMGCMGNTAIKTPYLDMLAAQGTLFTNAYTPTPSCVPARACLLTGMNQWHTGIFGMGPGMTQIANNYAHTLPGELSAAGFHTCAVGTNHFYPRRSLNGYHSVVLDEHAYDFLDNNFTSDYAEWYGQMTGDRDGFHDTGLQWNGWTARPYHEKETLHPTHWTADQAINFLRKRDPAKPFFLKCSFVKPHAPYDPPEVYYNMYKDKELPKAYVGDWSAKHDVPKDAAEIDAWHGKMPEEDIQDARAGYYGNITFVDHSIGRVIDVLKQMRVYDDTLILFVADHGSMMGDHNLWRKGYAYEGSCHIPMIVRPPRGMGKTMQKCDKLVTLYDIMPTVLDAADLPIPETCDGMSVMPFVRGEDTAWRETLIGEHNRTFSAEEENIFVTDGAHKLIFFPAVGTLSFFDLENDPHELTDAIDDPAYADVIASLKQVLVAELTMRQWPVTDGKTLFAKPDPDYVMKSPCVGKYGVK